MTKQVSERVKLIEELVKHGYYVGDNIGNIADFILARDKKNAEPLVKCLNDPDGYDYMRDVIKATLTNLGVESKERV